MAVGSSKHQRVSLLGFDLRNKLTQRWTYIYNFHKRRILHRWQGLGSAGIFRFIVSLLISYRVLLLTLAINIVGIPKEQWYPNLSDSGFQITNAIRQLLTITKPNIQHHSFDWGNT